MGILLLSSIATCGMAYSQNTWIQKANFGGSPREGASGFSIGSKGYLGTGNNVGGAGYTQDFWEYDPITNVWTQKANFGGTGRSYAVGLAIGNKGYIGTGVDGTFHLQDFWEYDPSTNIWTQKANYGGNPLHGAVGFAIGNKGYIGTGSGNAGYTQELWEYDPLTNVWTQKSNFPGTARTFAVGFAIGNKGYIGTGLDNPAWTNDFWEYDPSTNIWTQKANFGGPVRNWATGFSIGSFGYLGTGNDFSGAKFNDFWQYDPSTNIWTQKANFGGTGRFTATGFAIGNKGYIGAGWDSISQKNDFWEYTPDTISSIFPITSLSSSDTSFCEKHCIDFFDLSTNSPTSWEWFFPGADSTTSTLQNPTNICYSTYGSFDVTLIACNTAGCDTLILSGFINEYPQPIPTISLSNDTLFSSPGISYQWFSVDSGIISGAYNYYYVPSYPGNYYVSITDSIGCVGISNVILITGINELLFENLKLIIVPNPNKGDFTLSFSSHNSSKGRIEIYNTLGQMVYSNSIEINEGENVIDLDLKNSESGIYFLNLKTEGCIYRKKLVKK